ncbi:MAG: hypothetical protein IT431_15630 [Phycisphaerales bacterium]|nr:hypothetical protein [Phycisphaerales bacterium]
MAERRSLAEGLKATPKVDSVVAREFVYEGKADNAPPVVVRPEAAAPSAPVINRVSLSTRIRDDYAKALKRASLERQLQGVEPNTLQDILEQAIEPWLRSNGYLS